MITEPQHTFYAVFFFLTTFIRSVSVLGKTSPYDEVVGGASSHSVRRQERPVLDGVQPQPRQHATIQRSQLGSEDLPLVSVRGGSFLPRLVRQPQPDRLALRGGGGMHTSYLRTRLTHAFERLLVSNGLKF